MYTRKVGGVGAGKIAEVEIELGKSEGYNSKGGRC
jgi:hypothetical protein